MKRALRDRFDGWLRNLSRSQRVGRVRIYGAPLYWRWSGLIPLAIYGLMTHRVPSFWPIMSACWLTIVIVHELGHAFIAHRLGYGIHAVTIGGFHGSCEHDAPEYESHDIAIAWGGVAAQALLAVVALLLHWGLGALAPPHVRLALVSLGYLNLFVALLNLLPVPGFDGATAWRALPLAFGHWRSRLVARKTLRRLAKAPRSRLRVITGREKQS